MTRFALIAAGAVGLAGIGTLVGLGDSAPAVAAVQVRTAKFTVANMTCATCPIAVKKAMSNVAGVRSVSIDFDSKTATVAFDPSTTSAARIAAASGAIGFPAKLVR